MNKTSLFFFLLCLVNHILLSQDKKDILKSDTNQVRETDDSRFSLQEAKFYQSDKVSVGLGLGAYYGGLGGNVLLYPYSNVGIFGGIGYNLLGTGFNVGAKIRIVQDSTWNINPYITVMYGTNSKVIIEGADQYNKMFNGYTFGLGLDQKWKNTKNGYSTFALIIPISSQELKRYVDDLKKSKGIETKESIFPIALSIGYHFVIK